jgi:predicted nucleic acid-binding protein
MMLANRARAREKAPSRRSKRRQIGPTLGSLADALPLDFADASVVLLAMRADVREILTADRRDFAV